MATETKDGQQDGIIKQEFDDFDPTSFEGFEGTKPMIVEDNGRTKRWMLAVGKEILLDVRRQLDSGQIRRDVRYLKSGEESTLSNVTDVIFQPKHEEDSASVTFIAGDESLQFYSTGITYLKGPNSTTVHLP